MRVIHPPVTRPRTACPTYACTLAVEHHERPDDLGQLWHRDDSTGVQWPTASWDDCDGGIGCSVSVHEHGCYSDMGSWNHPEEHSEPSDSGTPE